MPRLFIALLLLPFPTVLFAAATIDDYAMQAEQVADGVYAVISPARDFPSVENKGWNSNAAFVLTQDGILVFDTGSSETIGKALLKTIRRVSDAPVRWVINSHGHGDHWLGNAAFAGENPREMIASDTAKARMEKDGHDWVERFSRMTGGATGDFQPLPAKDAVSAAVERDFGGVKVHLLFSNNGHSPGDIAAWLPQKGVLMTGDTLYTQRPPATFDANVPHWIEFLKTLSALQPKVAIPGHGPVGDTQSVKDLHDYFDTLWKAVTQAYEAGQADFEAIPAVKEKMARFENTFPGMEERLGESVSHVYLQVEAALF